MRKKLISNARIMQKQRQKQIIKTTAIKSKCKKITANSRDFFMRI